MSFRGPHISFVSFAVEVQTSGITQVMIIETDLHLNPKHRAYSKVAVEDLIASAQNYANANIEGSASIRLVSTRSGEI